MLAATRQVPSASPTGTLYLGIPSQYKSLLQLHNQFGGCLSKRMSFLEQAKLSNNARRGAEQEPELLFHGKHHIQNLPLF